MLWIRVHKNVPLRIVEWLTAFAMVLVGLYLVVWPAAFERAGLTGFAAIAPAAVWVGASLVIGAARVAALVLNGHRAEVSAPIRCAGAILGVGFFASIAAGYAMANLSGGPPMATIFAIVLASGDLFSAARSGRDTFTAARSARHWTGFLR